MNKNEYRLGDIICGFMNSSFSSQNSIGKEYKKKTNKVNDFKLLNNIIKLRTPTSDIPLKNDLVIHIRLGDVIENSKYNVDDYWESSKILNSVGNDISPKVFYIHNKHFYEDIKLIIKNYDIKNVILVTFFHRSSTHEKSLKYLDKIKNVFKSYNIVERINKDIDDDFIYCSNSKYFVGSGGGFSHLIGKLVELNGNLVFNNKLIHTRPGIFQGMWVNSESLNTYQGNKDIINEHIKNPNMRGVWVPQRTHKTIMPNLNFYKLEWSSETNVFYYDTSLFNFYDLINNLFNEKLGGKFNLYKIHDFFDSDIKDFYNKELRIGINDRDCKLIKIFHNFVDSCEDFNILYKNFISNFVIKLFPDEKSIIFQKTPNIRFHIPNKSNIGRKDTDPSENIIGLHNDTIFGHPDKELNVILPLTLMFDTNSIFFEKSPNSKTPYEEYESLNLMNNCISINYFNKCLHYNKINRTPNTRVSLDFRIIPGSLFSKNENQTLTKRKFVIGDYYDLIEK